MKADNVRKRERLFDAAIKQAKELNKKGFFEGAALAYLKAAKLFPESEYPEKLVACFNNAGFAYYNAKNYDQAEDYLEQALAISEKIFNEEHPTINTVLVNLGCIYSAKNEFDKAEDFFQRTLAIREKTLDKGHPDVAAVLNNLGTIYSNKKEFNKAENYFQQAKTIIEKTPLKISNDLVEKITTNHRNVEQEIVQLKLEKLEAQAALYQSKKLEYLGQMATLMAHNINQPIGVLRMATSGALSNINENLFNPETDTKPLLEKILNQTERLSLIMSNFRNFARSDRTVLSAVNLNSVIEDIYQLLFIAQYQLDKIELTKELHESPIAHANEFALQEMLISLLSNAREAVKDKTIKQIGIKTWQENNHVGFCVEDSGDGIGEENKEKLFTPFLSSKNEGMGLGLYFCREIAKDLGGAIEYYPSPLGGAGFKITLPKQQDNENGTAI